MMQTKVHYPMQLKCQSEMCKYEEESEKDIGENVGGGAKKLPKKMGMVRYGRIGQTPYTSLRRSIYQMAI
jgi:hypothetical protein